MVDLHDGTLKAGFIRRAVCRPAKLMQVRSISALEKLQCGIDYPAEWLRPPPFVSVEPKGGKHA
jgi:hypothetical protein